MTKFTLIREDSTYCNNTKQTVEFSTVSLDQILEEFEYFLKGAGFQFDGKIIVDQETWPATEDCNIEIDDLQYELNQDYDDSFSYTIQATQESEPIPKKKKGKN